MMCNLLLSKDLPRPNAQVPRCKLDHNDDGVEVESFGCTSSMRRHMVGSCCLPRQRRVPPKVAKLGTTMLAPSPAASLVMVMTAESRGDVSRYTKVCTPDARAPQPSQHITVNLTLWWHNPAFSQELAASVAGAKVALERRPCALMHLALTIS